MRSRVIRMASFVVAVMLVAQTTGVSLLARVTAPEIDGGTISAGLGLVTAGFLILRSRFRSK
jgi:hypothetical protein